MSDIKEERFWSMPMAMYCGFLLREPMALKMRELLKKQTSQIEKLIRQNIDQIEIARWTHVNIDGKEGIVEFYVVAEEEEKLERLKLLHEITRIQRAKSDVLKFTSNAEVEEFFNMNEENIDEKDENK